MAWKLRRVGLGLAGALALAALTASAALGAGERFHSHAEHTVVTADGENSFVITFKSEQGEELATLSCSSAVLEGDVTGTASGDGLYTSSQLTLGFDLFGCESSLGGSATVSENGCHFKLTSETDINGHASIELQCPGSPLEIKTEAGCVIKLGSQLEVLGVHYSNERNTASTNDDAITGTFTISGLRFETNFICQLGGLPKEGKNAGVDFLSTLKGFQYESGTTGNYREGGQVGIFKQ